MYDVAIIGAGAAGIEAAKLSLRKRLKTALIDRNYGSFGGVCLNKGCIPAKHYLNSSRYNKDIAAIYKDKDNIVETIKRPALEFIKKQGADVIWSDARLKTKNSIDTSSGTIEAKYIIVATGSYPFELVKTDNNKVFFAEDIFSFTRAGNKFLIVGAGAVGLEVACFLNNLGRDVLVIEKENRILPHFDRALSKRLKVILEKKGIKIRLGEDVNSYEVNTFDMVLLSAGRKPNVESLGLDDIGLLYNNGGWIKTDDYLKTNIDNIYACGDVTGLKLLAYVAEEHGRIAVENIAGASVKVNYSGLAESVFTQPQLAVVGMLEEEAKRKNIQYKTVKSNFLRFSSAYAYSDTDGFIQVLFDDDSNILGAAIISNIASELISIFSLAIKIGIKLTQIKYLNFIHPTLSEIIPKLLKS